MRLAIDTGLPETANAAGYVGTSGSIYVIIGKAISVLLGVVGVAFLIFIIWGGILWMIAAGDTDKVKKARSLMLNSTIALLFIVGAYAIANYVTGALITAVSSSS